MRKIFATMMMAACFMACGEKQFSIEGTFQGNETLELLTIEVTDENDMNKFLPVDTIEVKDGKFTYTKDIHSVVQAIVTASSKEEQHTYSIFLVPGETCELTLKGNEYFYAGGKTYEQMNEADKAITPLYKEAMDYYAKANKLYNEASEEEREELAKLLSDTIGMKMKTYQDGITKYAEEHKNEAGALLYLAPFINVKDSYEGMNEEMKKSPVGEYFKKLVENTEKQAKEAEAAEEEAQKKLDEKIGKPAKDFTLKDIKGKDLSLSSLRGKYVVIDFWGSWCGWCIKGMPDMKKYYEKYAGQFEILGVDCNDTEEDWKAAVEKNELPWLHVYNPADSEELTDYEVSGFPTKVLVDPEGNIAKIIVGEDPAFYDLLDQVLGGK